MHGADKLIKDHGEDAVLLADILHEACVRSAGVSNPDIANVYDIRSDGHGLNFVVAVRCTDEETGRDARLKRVIITSP